MPPGARQAPLCTATRMRPSRHYTSTAHWRAATAFPYAKAAYPAHLHTPAQDGNNCLVKGKAPLVRLAINVSAASSARSLDYLEMAADNRLIDESERADLLVCSISQDQIWHGCAQTVHGYIQGVSSCCHSSSAGVGPCLKRIITVFELPVDNPLARLSAVERLLRVGIAVHAVDARHQLGRGAAH